MGRYTAAIADFKHTDWLELELAAAAPGHAQRGDYDQAEKAATSIAQKDSGNGTELYRAAQCSAHLAAIVRNEAPCPPLGAKNSLRSLAELP